MKATIAAIAANGPMAGPNSSMAITEAARGALAAPASSATIPIAANMPGSRYSPSAGEDRPAAGSRLTDGAPRDRPRCVRQPGPARRGPRSRLAVDPALLRPAARPARIPADDGHALLRRFERQQRCGGG